MARIVAFYEVPLPDGGSQALAIDTDFEVPAWAVQHAATFPAGHGMRTAVGRGILAANEGVSMVLAELHRRAEEDDRDEP